MEWAEEAGQRLCDQLVEMVARHERDEHGGESCDGVRIGLLALTCHALGLTEETLARYLPALLAEVGEYEVEMYVGDDPVLH